MKISSKLGTVNNLADMSLHRPTAHKSDLSDDLSNECMSKQAISWSNIVDLIILFHKFIHISMIMKLLIKLR